MALDAERCAISQPYRNKALLMCHQLLYFLLVERRTQAISVILTTDIFDGVPDALADFVLVLNDEILGPLAEINDFSLDETLPNLAASTVIASPSPASAAGRNARTDFLCQLVDDVTDGHLFLPAASLDDRVDHVGLISSRIRNRDPASKPPRASNVLTIPLALLRRRSNLADSRRNATGATASHQKRCAIPHLDLTEGPPLPLARSQPASTMPG